MADLTRFDFHALRFLKSENVSEMSLEEVAQYVFLLCEAWIGGKDVSLPDNTATLAKLARCSRVSAKVLRMFPVTDTQWGSRRRNETLYGEWTVAVSRTVSAQERGRRGAEVRYSDSSAIAQPYSSYSRAIAQTNPNQAVPNQTKENICEFKNLSIHYKQIFGIFHSKQRKVIDRYHQECGKYGEDFVLEEFDSWAKSNMWVKDHRNSNFGLNFFWPQLEIAWAARVRSQSEQEPADNLESVLAAIDQQKLVLAQQDKLVEDRRQQEESIPADAF